MYSLGKRSMKELEGVHPDLVAVVKRAIEITAQDFAVHDGIRTRDEQAALVAKGASQTMDSRHLTGHAVDLVPYINGKLRWEWPPIYLIALAVRQAAREQGTKIRWGGAWSVSFVDSNASPEFMVSLYVAQCRDRHQPAFIDGPHFELPRQFYP